MLRELALCSLAGMLVYKITKQHDKFKYDPPICSPHMEMIMREIAEYKEKHPECELDDRQLFKAFR